MQTPLHRVAIAGGTTLGSLRPSSRVHWDAVQQRVIRQTAARHRLGPQDCRVENPLVSELHRDLGLDFSARLAVRPDAGDDDGGAQRGLSEDDRRYNALLEQQTRLLADKLARTLRYFVEDTLGTQYAARYGRRCVELETLLGTADDWGDGRGGKLVRLACWPRFTLSWLADDWLGDLAPPADADWAPRTAEWDWQQGVGDAAGAVRPSAGGQRGNLLALPSRQRHGRDHQDAHDNVRPADSASQLGQREATVIEGGEGGERDARDARDARDGPARDIARPVLNEDDGRAEVGDRDERAGGEEQQERGQREEEEQRRQTEEERGHVQDSALGMPQAWQALLGDLDGYVDRAREAAQLVYLQRLFLADRMLEASFGHAADGDTDTKGDAMEGYTYTAAALGTKMTELEELERAVGASQRRLGTFACGPALRAGQWISEAAGGSGSEESRMWRWLEWVTGNLEGDVAAQGAEAVA